MKKIGIILLGLLCISMSASAFEPPNTTSNYFYTIQTDQEMTERELADACSHDLDQAKAKLAQISRRLSFQKNDTLRVSATYGWTPSDPFPEAGGQYVFYCILNFSSADPTLYFEASSKVRFFHLKKSEWKSACEPAYEAALTNPNSPVTMEWLSLTLFKGRTCEVTTMEVRKVSPTIK